MPIGIGTATAIGAGLGALGQGANMAFTGNMNKKNRRFAEKQYKQQREDQLEFWRMNNQYNHPSAQMERLREGGLNPHLMYGQGTSGLTSSMADTPQQAKWQGEAPQLDTGFATNSLDQLYNLQAKKAQTDNLREQNTLLKKEQNLKDMELLQRSVNLNTSKLGYQYDKQTFQSRVLKHIVDNIDTQSRTTERNQRLGFDQFVFDHETKPSARKQLGMRQKEATLKSTKVQNALKAEHLRLRKQGIEPGDVVYIRAIAAILNRFGIEL